MRLLFLILFISGGIAGLSQSSNDTITIFYNHKWEVITSGQPTYLGLAWKEGNKWHKQDFYYPEMKLQVDGTYSDNDFKIKDGIITKFYFNGMMMDSCFYRNKKREGTEIIWDEEGNQRSLLLWNDDLPVDTAVWWNNKGIITSVQVTDSLGNGLYNEFLEDGKTIKVTGKLESGKRTGKWTFKDSDNILSAEIIYLADSAITMACYDKNGELENKGKECVVEKAAEFKGGEKAWLHFLIQNLIYPDYAQEKGIKGVVRIQFIVSKTGELSEFKIVSSPHESLSNEVLRLMKISPIWEPALQYNRPVIYRQVQGITFQLQ